MSRLAKGRSVKSQKDRRYPHWDIWVIQDMMGNLPVTIRALNAEKHMDGMDMIPPVFWEHRIVANNIWEVSTNTVFHIFHFVTRTKLKEDGY